MNVVKNVLKGSIADEIGIQAGDVLLSVNGQRLCDILDYKFLTSNDEYTLEIQKQNGDVEIVEVVNEDYEQLGIEFENGLLDKPQSCRNKCIFCFVDQLPKGMRKTLYFKDDDYRLSTLMGNYITLTNLKENDIKRIIDMHLPRINVSVHTVDRDLRKAMLHNDNSDVLSIMKRFAKAGIFMNCQVVLCRGINDGKYLDDTILSLAEMYPYVQSLSVVPVGLTKHREGLQKLIRFDKISAEEIIGQIEGHQKNLLTAIGTRFVFASDEFYVLSEHKLPPYDSYEDFLQIENGVGLLSSLEHEFNEALTEGPHNCERKTIATGVSAFKYIKNLVGKVTDNVEVIPIINNFFGSTITVAGLITGRDIIDQLKGRDLGSKLLLPSVMLNYDNVFLDDTKITDVEDALNIKVEIVPNDGYEFFRSLLD